MAKTKDEEDIHIAEIQRSLNSVADAWENDVSIDVDDMCEHLEQVGAVVDGDIGFNEFIDSTGLKDIKDS